MREPHVIAQFATSLSKLENKGFTQILNKICFSDIFEKSQVLMNTEFQVLIFFNSLTLTKFIYLSSLS